jgi:tRNA (cytosine38-C5)-methyltransferase
VQKLPSCDCDNSPSEWKCPLCMKPILISVEKQQKTLESYLETLLSEDVDSFLLSEKTLAKYGQILDIRRPQDASSCCFTKAYSHYAEGTGSVLQHNSSLSIEECFLKFQETSDVDHLKRLQLRYFTPREVSNLMGFPKDFDFPESTSIRTRYRLLGNSLNVVVVANLLRLLVS